MKSKFYKDEIKSIVRQYRLFKIRLMNPRDLRTSQKKKYRAFTFKFDSCLDSLELNQKKAFKLAFMSESFDWWDLNYSIAHCYRLRKESGMEFLRLFKEE